MVTLTPKSAPAPDFAIRLENDVIAETGKWLVFFGGEVRVMEHAEVLLRYEIDGTPPPKGRAANYGVDLTEQGLRVLSALMKAGGVDCRVCDLRRFLAVKDREQASARLAQAHFHGLVGKRLPFNRTRGFLWSITDAGRQRLVREAASTETA